MENIKNYESPKMEIVFVDGGDVMSISNPIEGGQIGGGDNPFEF